MPARPRPPVPSAIGLEPLEGRITPAVRYVDNPGDYVITTDQGAPGLDNGDTVTFNPSGGTQTPVTGLIFGTDAFSTIQAAVNFATAGDTINVAQGTFAEQVNVNKQLFLRGNQAGADARAGRTGLPATETVLDDTANSGRTPVFVTASDVVLDGFTVQGTTNGNNFGFGVLINAGTAGTEVRNNIIQNNIAGISLANTSAANPTVISQNLIRNNNQPGPVGGTGIYTDQFNAGGALAGVVIDANDFLGNDNVAVLLGSTLAGTQSGVTISNNSMSGSGNAVLLFNLLNSSVFRNTISGSLGSQVVIGGGVNGLTVSENFIQGGATRGVRVGDFGGGGTNQNVTVTRNSITGNPTAGLDIDAAAGAYTGTLNAELNWWGSPTGPTNPTNPGGTGDAVIDPLNQVDFVPFLGSGTDFQPATPGFQPSVVNLQVTKTDAPDPVVAGTVLTYTITVTNAGPDEAPGVTITDTFPAELSNVQYTSVAAGGATGNTAAGNGNINDAAVTLPAGASVTYTVTGTVSASAAAVSNTATATATAASFELDPTNDAATATTTVTSSADLSVVVTDSPDPVTAGQNLTYTITVTNAGPSDAQTVTLTDQLPPNTTFVSFAQTTGPAFTAATPPAGGAGTVTATAATLAAGATATFTLVVNVNAGTPLNTVLSNTATAGAATADVNALNNSGTATTSVATAADLRVTATDTPDPVRANGLLTYTITVSNTGPSGATTVTLTDQIPANTTFVSFAQTAGPAFTPTTPPAGGTGPVTATAATLAAGATATFTLVVRVNPGTPVGTLISNTASAASLTADPTPADNSATETTRVAGAILPVVVGAGAGSSRVRVFDPVTGAETRSFFAYTRFAGGVRVAAGDVTGDGVADIITGAGPGGAAHVKVFDGVTGAEVRSFFAYAPTFLGGVFVAAGDVDGDGFADIVTGAGAGAGPHVKVFSGRTGAEILSFFAYAPNFLGGVTVAAGDVDGDGRADVVTGASDGGSSHVKVFGPGGAERASFFAFDSIIRGGVFVAAGDLDGDGRAEVIAGDGRTAAEVKLFIFDGGGTAKAALFVQDPETVRSGSRVAVADRGADGRLDLVTGAGPGTAPVVQVFDGRTLARVDQFLAFEAGAMGGVFVG